MKLIPGSGRFAGSSFAPLVPGLWEHPYLVRDFTRGLEGQAPLSETGHGYDVGRYNERRRSMYTSELFGGTPASPTYTLPPTHVHRRLPPPRADPWAAGVPPSQRRDIHIGIDIGGPVGTAVHAVADGTVHSSGYNVRHALSPDPWRPSSPATAAGNSARVLQAAALDYGHVVVTEHRLCGVDVWALHGHLSADSSVRWRPGDKVARGEVLGWLGGTHENGGAHARLGRGGGVIAGRSWAPAPG